MIGDLALEVEAGTQPLWVIGAGGMLAGELLRLAHDHPVFRLAGAVTRTGGDELDALHPHLAGASFDAGPCQDLEHAVGAIANELEAAPGPGWLVLALPHGDAAAVWRSLRTELGEAVERLGVVDLSADYRLRDAAAYERWYGGPHADPVELSRFVYGLPELAGESLLGARRIAAPGCFATALQLACVPAARAGLVDGGTPWVLHAITGSSGSGNAPKPGTHHPHRHGNLWSYAGDGHRHEAELLQALAPSGLRPPLTFLPHSGPWVRGIHLSAVLPLREGLTDTEARELFLEHYDGCPFVALVDGGVPDLRRVVGSNRAALGARVRNGSLVVEVTLDNLIKGGSGQALQAMNLAAGLPETLGLPRTGLGVA